MIGAEHTFLAVRKGPARQMCLSVLTWKGPQRSTASDDREVVGYSQFTSHDARNDSARVRARADGPLRPSPRIHRRLLLEVSKRSKLFLGCLGVLDIGRGAPIGERFLHGGDENRNPVSKG